MFASYPSLDGRVVVVTGGASGIGADMVRAFATNRAKVAFLDVQAEAGRAVADELASRAFPPQFFQCDLVDVAALQRAIAEIGERIGPVAVLVNNAADDDRHKVADVTVEYWDRSQATNLRHQFFAAQAVHPQMRALGHGSIINLSSIGWRGGPAELASYAAAKAAVLGLTRSLARAFGPDNIRVNAIEPGAVMTERQRRLWYQSEQSVQAMVDRQCLKQVLLGEEIARMALFLAADDSRMITRQSMIVDAGLS